VNEEAVAHWGAAAPKEIIIIIIGGMILTGYIRSYRRKSCPSGNLSIRKYHIHLANIESGPHPKTGLEV